MGDEEPRPQTIEVVMGRKLQVLWKYSKVLPPYLIVVVVDFLKYI
jgi:hypothetical protein